MRYLVGGLFCIAACSDSEGAPGSAAADSAQAAALDAAAEGVREVEYPPAAITVSGVAREVRLRVACTAEGEPLAQLFYVGAGPESFQTDFQQPSTTRVVLQVDERAVSDERWTVIPPSAEARSPAPVSLGQQLLGAQRVAVTIWPYAGDSATAVVDVRGRDRYLRSIASACRWPG